jgi:hypothetical protein
MSQSLPAESKQTASNHLTTDSRQFAIGDQPIKRRAAQATGFRRFLDGQGATILSLKVAGHVTASLDVPANSGASYAVAD